MSNCDSKHYGNARRDLVDTLGKDYHSDRFKFIAELLRHGNDELSRAHN